MTAPQDPFSTPPGDGTPPPAGYGAPSGEPAGYGQPAGGFGAPTYGQQPGGFGAPGGFGGHVAPRNGFGVAALVLGILALVTSITVVGGVLLGIAAIVFGVLGRGRAKKGQATNGGMALAGLILGVLGLVLSIVLAAAVGSVLSRGDFGTLTECLDDAGNDQAAIDDCSAEFQDSVNG